MTNNLKCPFCGAELTINPHPFDGCVKARCVNVDCRYAEWTFPLEIWQALIDGKKAQDALKVAIKGIKEIEYDNERGLGEGGGLYSDDTPFEELLKEITSITTQELDK